VVMRPPPEGALYHRMANDRFDEVLTSALARDDVEVVLLPRTSEQAVRYRALSPRIRIPGRAVDGSSLLAIADLAIGAGGTMNRESAILGTPTYTVFAGRLAAVDAELMREGRLRDLRAPGTAVSFEKKGPARDRREPPAEAILAVIRTALADAARGPDSRQRPRRARRPS
jgi:uncharacterized protein